MDSNFVENGIYFANAELWKRSDLWLKQEDKNIYLPTMQIADSVREHCGQPILIASARRSYDYQMMLIAQGLDVATVSPHVLGLAIDLSLRTRLGKIWIEHEDMVNIIKSVSTLLSLPVRIGWKKYKKKEQYFVHFDTAPEWVNNYAQQAMKLSPAVLNAYSINGLEW